MAKGATKTMTRTAERAGLERAVALFGCMLVLVAIGVGLEGAPAWAVQTSTWKTGGILDFARADAINVAITTDGVARLAPRREQLFDPGQAYVWCMAEGPDGTIYAGTGDDGLIVAIPRFGEPHVVHDSIELQILALAVGEDGAVYAGGSPDGTILHIMNGEVSTYFDTPESYIWALTWGADGALYAATGDRGRLYRVTAAGRGELVYDSSEVHLLAMVRAGDDLILGTSPGGLVARYVAPDSALVLYDAAEDEIKALAYDADGAVYVAAVGQRARQESDDRSADWISAQNGSRGNGDGAQVYRLMPDGAVQRLWHADEEMVLSLEPDGDGGVFAGTGSRGTLVHLDARGSATRLFETDESQVLAVSRAGDALLMATANPGRIYRVGPDVEAEGYLTSEIFDARNVAAWGRLRWQSSHPPGTTIRLQVRSGNTRLPDESWSPWSAPLRDGRGEPIPSPAARFVQWRARLVGAGSFSPLLESVMVAYRERNLPPHLHAVDVVATDGGLQPIDNGGPPDRVLQTLPSGVQVEFAFPRAIDRPVRLDQVAWLRSTRIASWVVDDPNDDRLVFDLHVKGEDETTWKLLAEDLDDQIHAFQTAELDDGRYRVKVEASDAGSNPAGLELTDTLVSRPFLIDNTPPELSALRGQRGLEGGLVVSGTALDRLSIIVSLEYSLDAGEWQPFFPEDSIFDAFEEPFRVVVDVERDARLGEDLDRERTVLVRAADEAGNVAARKVVIP
jgi:hypothetical protein